MIMMMVKSDDEDDEEDDVHASDRAGLVVVTRYCCGGGHQSPHICISARTGRSGVAVSSAFVAETQQPVCPRSISLSRDMLLPRADERKITAIEFPQIHIFHMPPPTPPPPHHQQQQQHSRSAADVTPRSSSPHIPFSCSDR
ncbi:hypothetical protein C0Q70_08208 [Pomacea canaliculata]|uniref:Uncharacterized protein n=1 Tax=Pomacea canaliculata TaxID=400727 RepID=A0A2T7PH71_POMCA|nr:hypothetical protein C0Q70_08208 [Pomacea canaliculata]